MASPGLMVEDSLEIYKAHLQALSRLFSEIRSELRTSGFTITNNYCLLALVKIFWKNQNCCAMVIPYPSLHFHIQLIKMSEDICKLILKETNLLGYNNSTTISRVLAVC